MSVPQKKWEAVLEATTGLTSRLDALANASIDFAVTTLIVAALTALFLQATYEFGWRKTLNKRTTRSWLRHRMRSAGYKFPLSGGPKDTLILGEDDLLANIGIARESPIFSLPYTQLCAQISNSLQSAVDFEEQDVTVSVFAGLRGENRDLGPEQELIVRIERGVDELQSELARAWGRSGYLLSYFLTSFLLIVLVLAATGFEPDFGSISLVIMIAAASTLLAPAIQRMLDRVFVARFDR